MSSGISFEKSFESPRRILRFQGIDNFRDLGGYPTSDGRHIKWGKLYRSGHLAFATNKDQQKIKKLGIHTLVDFRSDQERDKKPDRLPNSHNIRTLTFPIQENGQPPLASEIRDMIKKRELNGLDPDLKMRQLYSLLASKYTEQYKQFFYALLNANGRPILWHCSAGKDRAGFAAAILLKTLNIQDDSIFEDYLLSQGNIAPLWRQLLFIGLLRGIEAARFLNRMNDIDKNWLHSAFAYLEDTWGDFDIYLSKGLDLNPAKIERLQTIYLE